MSQRPRPHAAPPATATDKAIQQGLQLHEQGRFTEALACFDAILQRAPRNAPAHWHAGRALLMQQLFRRALPYLEEAVALLPGKAAPLYDLAFALGGAGLTEESAKRYQEVVALQPDWPHAWSRLGRAQIGLKRYADAETNLRHALTLTGFREETLCNLGLLAKARVQLDTAVEYFLTAIKTRPKFAEAWNNLASTLADQNKLDEAEFAYRQSRGLEPNNPIIKFNQAILELRQGKFSRDTWLRYEYRWIAIQANPQRGFTQPLWRGQEPLAGKSILLYAEQGLGDTIQFARYAAPLAALGATVHVEVQPALKPVMQNLPGATSVIAAGEPLPAFDLCCPLLSLPLALDTQLATIPSAAPYLQAPPDQLARWNAEFPSGGPIRVGVVWRGNPKHSNDAHRSVNFATFQRLFAAANCEFVCLQVGLNETEAAAFAGHSHLVNPTDQIKDFADTAAIIMQLDLVIAVDTSVAHLAGALGKPTWVLLPFSPDWRWMLGRNDSPWYPSVRLFRQPTIGDWDTVISDVCAALPLLTCPEPEIAPQPISAHTV